MSDRRERLESELALLEIEEKHREAKKAYRGDKSAKNRRAFEKARDALVDARQSQRKAEGRSEGTGVSKVGG